MQGHKLTLTPLGPEPGRLALNLCFFQRLMLWSTLSCWGFADLTHVRPSSGPVSQAGSRVREGKLLGKEAIGPTSCSALPQGEKGFWTYKPCFVEISGWGGTCCPEQWSGTPPSAQQAASDGPPDPHP